MPSPAAVAPARAPATAAGTRLAWLDGLRAVAVLLVVYAHLTRYVFTGVRAVTAEWLHAGTAGVMLFFLVSGYIIPASLERHGSPRRFWISRAGRLLPLYLVVGASVVALGLAGLVPIDGALTDRPVTAVVAHLTMLPVLLGVPLATPLFWTLTFEMVFYLLVTALVTGRGHRYGGVVAIVLAGAAVLVAPLPARLFGASVTWTVAVLLAAGLAAVVSGRRWAVRPGAILLAVLALTLTVLNQDPAHVWDGLLILAVMFTGTLIQRADSGRTGWWPVAVVGPIVAAALLHNWFAELVSLEALSFRYAARAVITLLVFAGAFALAMLTRHRWRTPRPLVRIGVLSYSIYLVHWVLLQLCAPLLTGPLTAAAFLALVIGVSWLTHRYVELPGQRWARRWQES